MGAQESVQDLERATAVGDAPPLPEDFTFVGGGDDPLAVAKVLQDAGIGESPVEDIPLIEPPAPDTVNLPGGLVIDSEVFRQAVVRELNGEDEEHIARAVAGNPLRFNQALLERGVVSIGPHKATEEILDKLLIGDRDALLLGVRQATYGDTIDLTVTCAHCGVESKIRVTLSEDVPVVQLRWDPTQSEHEVEVRDGVAVIRLTTGAAQRQVQALENKTVSEMNTVLLARCLVSINGEPVLNRLDTVRKLGMADRRALIDWLIENQPGPRYDDVKHACTVCRKETPLNLAAEHLFPGI